MEVIIILTAILAIAFPKSLPVHPGAQAMLMGSPLESIQCEEAKGSNSSIDTPRISRTANFRVFGSYECHRPIFADEERNSFVEHLIRSETSKAKRIAADLPSHLKNQKVSLSVRVWGINDPELERLIAALYRAELVSTLGSIGVNYMVDEQTVPRLDIEIRRVIAPDKMTKVNLITKTNQGEGVWKEL